MIMYSNDPDKDLYDEFDLANRPILNMVIDSKPCGRCEKKHVVQTTYEDMKNLKYPIMYYVCQGCGWEYVEQ
jgi:hypothetical protein